MKKLQEQITYESSTIESTLYDFKTNDLIVSFNSGASYMYNSVPESDYIEMKEADSVGKSFNQNIRQYGGIKIEETVAQHV
tara:strand:- start:51 stop:293 length:243 start_codon:yes stop_codon:yes gene_type:complete